MFSKPQKKARLERANPVESVFQKDIVIRISVGAVIVLAIIIFFIICFIVCPPTYGYLWY